MLEERLPLTASEKSIDLFIATKDFPEADRILERYGFKKRKPQFSLKHKSYFLIDRGDTLSFDIQVGGIFWNDLKYLDELSISKKRVKISYFYVLSDTDYVLMLLVHSILGKRHFKREYQEILSVLLASIDKGYLKSSLSEIFNPSLGKFIFERYAQKDYVRILRWKYLLVFFFIFKSSQNASTFSILFFRWIRWKKFFQLSPLIAIVGPDGAGKSTLASFLEENLLQSGRKVSRVYVGRGRGQLLPITSLGKMYKRAEKRDLQRGEHFKPFKRIFYLMAAPVFALDLMSRYWFRIFPRRLCKSIVITDRYCSDILLMKHVPFFLKLFLFRLFPRPTTTFYLHNTPEILHQRRPQESIPELERQLEIFSETRKHLKMISVKTKKSDIVTWKVLDEILCYCYREWY